MGSRLRDVLTFSGVTAAVGGSLPLQLYCHRHNSIIIIFLASFFAYGLILASLSATFLGEEVPNVHTVKRSEPGNDAVLQ